MVWRPQTMVCSEHTIERNRFSPLQSDILLRRFTLDATLSKCRPAECDAAPARFDRKPRAMLQNFSRSPLYSLLYIMCTPISRIRATSVALGGVGQICVERKRHFACPKSASAPRKSLFCRFQTKATENSCSFFAKQLN